MNTVSIDDISSFPDFCRCSIYPSEACCDKFFAVFVQQIEGVQMSTGGYLNQLCKSIPDLGFWQSAQKGEVEEGVDWCMVSSQSILVVAIVDSNFDGDGGVDQTNHSRRDSDDWYVLALVMHLTHASLTVGVASVRGACESCHNVVSTSKHFFAANSSECPSLTRLYP